LPRTIFVHLKISSLLGQGCYLTFWMFSFLFVLIFTNFGRQYPIMGKINARWGYLGHSWVHGHLAPLAVRFNMKWSAMLALV